MNDGKSSAGPSVDAAAPVKIGEVVKAAEHGRLNSFLRARLERKSYLGLHLTVGLAVLATGIWLFGTLLDALLDNARMVKMDLATDAFIHAHMPASLLGPVLAITDFGGPLAMTSLGIIGTIVLWRTKRNLVLVGWIAAFAGVALIGEVLKRAVHRTRPTYGAAFVQTDSFSFPSGHAMGSMLGYGMLLWVLFLFWHPRRTWKIVLYALGILLVLAIGVSRILLGVHYPSDVASGWAAALAWLAVCITGVNVARHRPITT